MEGDTELPNSVTYPEAKPRLVLLGQFRLELERSRRLLNFGRSRRLSRLFVSARADRDLLLLKN